MNAVKQNYKSLFYLQLVLIGLALFVYVFLNNDSRKISLIVLGTIGISIVIQAVIYTAKPEWYGNKTKKQPHQV